MENNNQAIPAVEVRNQPNIFVVILLTAIITAILTASGIYLLNNIESSNRITLPVEVTSAPTVEVIPEELPTLFLFYKDRADDPNILEYVADKSIGIEVQPHEYTVENAVYLLINQELNQIDIDAGLESQFDQTDSRLKSLNLISIEVKGGVATLTFEDPEYYTSGGSGRVSLMKSQIEETVKQFNNVDSVIILPNLLFQP